MRTPLRLFVASFLALWIAAPVSAQGQEKGASPPPLSRFIPANDLIAYAQLDGIDGLEKDGCRTDAQRHDARGPV